MQKNTGSIPHHDVLVVGFGPAGAVAASLLGRLGHDTLVIDKSREIYDKPRAIALDHEILRHFDNMGLAEAVLEHVAPFTASEHFGADGQLIRRIDMVPAPYPLGYTPSMVFTQPPVEAIIRSHAESLDSVTVDLGVELIALREAGDHVEADLKASDGTLQTVTASYVIGCDGASSRVRDIAGIRLEDLIFDEPWLVVDVKVHDSGLAKLPQNSAQFCNPARPTSYVIGPGNHRRWEIMLLPGENPRQMEEPKHVWQLLSPWLTPEDGELWRSASYRFHALVADHWRKGRIFIAGDAAHQQPPFIGQGMCQGLRDVTNLVWKLDRVMRGVSPDSLLDTYGAERKRHVEELTGRIKAIGETICILDPALAAARDARILAEGGGKPATVTRQEIVPPLREGLLADENAPARGTLFPQPAIGANGKAALLDTIIGNGWRLIVDGRRETVDLAALEPLATRIGLTVATIAPKGQGRDGMLEERDDIMAAWFDRHGATSVLVRPDHYVYGAARDAAELKSRLAELAASL
ncbi:MAG TPA: bifunctional 3-(3-hydroxy-phenyl)propionate/3-hydroxycinnamic acid hydroxylase [Ensifer sp.]|nr:bifunctional 3-(3-hydroxy-phenyl)propionate/3-hydroxycinnamic acid hydroxylase [Ensifer sp.]